MKRALSLLVVLCSILFGQSTFAVALTTTDILTPITRYAANGEERYEAIFDLVPMNLSINKDGQTYAVTVSITTFRKKMLSYSQELLGCNYMTAGITGCQPGYATGPYFWGYGRSIVLDACPDPYDSSKVGRRVRYVGSNGTVTTNSVCTGGTDFETGLRTSFWGQPDKWPDNAGMWRDNSYPTGIHSPSSLGASALTISFWRSWLKQMAAQIFNDKKPTIADLTTNWGISIVGAPFTDAGYGGGFDPGTGDAGSSSGGTTDPDGPADSATNCGILDIPCNFRALFIPREGFFLNYMQQSNISVNVNMPYASVDNWVVEDLFDCDPDNGTGPRFDHDPNYPVGYFSIDPSTLCDIDFVMPFNDWQIPQVAMDQFRMIAWWTCFFWMLSYLGLPVLRSAASGYINDQGPAEMTVVDAHRERHTEVPTASGEIHSAGGFGGSAGPNGAAPGRGWKGRQTRNWEGKKLPGKQTSGYFGGSAGHKRGKK